MKSPIKAENIEFGDKFRVIDSKYINHFGLIGEADTHIFDNAVILLFQNGDRFKFYFTEIERT